MTLGKSSLFFKSLLSWLKVGMTTVSASEDCM